MTEPELFEQLEETVWSLFDKGVSESEIVEVVRLAVYAMTVGEYPG